MWKEFKEFVITGNVIDFAIVVIVAGGVALVVNSFYIGLIGAKSDKRNK